MNVVHTTRSKFAFDLISDQTDKFLERTRIKNITSLQLNFVFPRSSNTEQHSRLRKDVLFLLFLLSYDKVNILGGVGRNVII